MAIDISSLEQLPILDPNLVTRKIYEDTILNRINIEVVTGATPGPYRFRIFDPVAHLSKCCQPYNGNSNVTEKDLEVICFKDGQTYCETDLAQIIRNTDFRFTAGKETAGSLEMAITEGQMAAFLEAVDKLTFQGNTTSSDPNLNLYDGWLKQARDNGGTVITADTGNLYDAIINGFLALPEDALKMGQIAIFVPERYGLMFRLALTSLRLFVDNPKNDLNVPGLGNDVVIIPTRGLTGVDSMLVTPLRNLRYLTNQKADLNTFEWKYIVDKDGDYYIWRVKAIYGVALIFEDWSVVVDVDPSVLTNPIAIPVSIASPLNADGSAIKVDPSTAAAGASLNLNDPALLAAALEANGYSVPAAVKRDAEAQSGNTQTEE